MFSLFIFWIDFELIAWSWDLVYCVLFTKDIQGNVTFEREEVKAFALRPPSSCGVDSCRTAMCLRRCIYGRHISRPGAQNSPGIPANCCGILRSGQQGDFVAFCSSARRSTYGLPAITTGSPRMHHRGSSSHPHGDADATLEHAEEVCQYPATFEWWASLT